MPTTIKTITKDKSRLTIAKALLGLSDPTVSRRDLNQVEVIKNHFSDTAKELGSNAAGAAFLSLPVVTGLGLSMMFTKSSGNDYGMSSLFRALGFPVFVGGIFIDAVKLPFTLAASIFNGVAAGVYGLLGLTHSNRKDYENQVKSIYKSFDMRLRKTMFIISLLEIETPQNLFNEEKQDEADLSVVLMTLLYTAFDSRNLDGDKLQLASGAMLTRENTPISGRPIFDELLKLKKHLQKTLSDNPEVAIPQFIDQLRIIMPLLKEKNNIRNITNPDIVHINALQNAKTATASLLHIKALVARHLNNARSNHRSVKDVKPEAIRNMHTSLNRHLESSEGGLAGPLNDHISFDAYKDPVLANDGVYYNRETAENLIRNRQRGTKGIVLCDYKELSKEVKDLFKATSSGPAESKHRSFSP